MINRCRIGFLVRNLSRFSIQRLASFSSSSAASPRFLDSSTDEDEFKERDGSAVYRHALLNQRPSTTEWTPSLVNSVSFIGRVDRQPVIYKNKGGSYGCYTLLNARNPRDSNCSFRVLVEMWDDVAKTCVRHLKPNDFIYVSGHLESFIKVDKEGNPRSNYKILVNELRFVAQPCQRPTCRSLEKLKLEVGQNPEELESKTGQKPEESNSETCQKYNEPRSGACQKYMEPYPGGEAGMGKEKSHDTLWEVFFSNPDEWWDYRKNKKNSESPDFKHKVTGNTLWLGPDDPPWVKRKLQSLDMKMGEQFEEGRYRNRLYLWQLFFSSPHEWWDNRKNKKNSRLPDFKHKDTGEVLWLSPNDPPWVKRQIRLLDLNMASQCQEKDAGSRSRVSHWVYDD